MRIFCNVTYISVNNSNLTSGHTGLEPHSHVGNSSFWPIKINQPIKLWKVLIKFLCYWDVWEMYDHTATSMAIFSPSPRNLIAAKLNRFTLPSYRTEKCELILVLYIQSWQSLKGYREKSFSFIPLFTLLYVNSNLIKEQPHPWFYIACVINVIMVLLKKI